MRKNMRLKYYEKERVEFKEEFEKKLTAKELDIVSKKLCRHFKIGPQIFYGRGSYANNSYIQISYKWGMNFGVLCHELAHYYCFRYNKKRGHNKVHWRVMKRFFNYCRKRNFWKEELDKRTEIKAKHIPAECEIRDKKIDKVKRDIERYNKRLNYFNKLYSNKIKKANKRLSMLLHYKNKLS